ncbi:DUF192 domain-containing protein [Halobaculum sp. MBLA0143]|uniref:DUF192 domain-containing protein n=1 Tax=Halobaculum sp. MBLA0143 TaxID=3079933 RepID=UPI00352648DF
MRVVHDPDGAGTTLASEVDVAEGFLAQACGLMFRRSIPDDYALVFPFGGVGQRDTHMVFVPFDIDAVWLVDGEVTACRRLAAWRGLAVEEADTLIELPAGAADGVAVGDRVRVEGLE